jgi:DNA-binding NarL/FixJ family response regulator
LRPSDEPPVFVHHRGDAAIRVVTSGQGLVAPQVTRRLIAEFARQPGRRIQPDRLRRLTERERQTLTLVARGVSNAEIAATLVVSPSTVKTHVGSAREAGMP